MNAVRVSTAIFRRLFAWSDYARKSSIPSILLRAVLLAAGMIFFSCSGAIAAEPQESAAGETPEFVAGFLAKHCVSCHGSQKPKGDLSLHDLAKQSRTGERVRVWRKVFNRLASGEMPPAKAPQPDAEERRQFGEWLGEMLVASGESLDAGRWLHPSRGNWVDHDALFSGSERTGAATRGRLWRLTGQAYEEFVQSLNAKYRLGFRTYGHSRVRSPWQLAASGGFRDYAAQHRIGEPEIEHHLRNTRRVAQALLARLPKARDPELQLLKAVLKNAKPLAGDQLEATAAAAFVGLLGRETSADERKRYAGFLELNLKTLPIEKSLEQLFVAILFHPEVMYRLELPAPGARRAMLPPRDLARAIAFAVTDREPDETLIAAAAAGQLKNAPGVRGQARRLLADPQIARPRLLRFFQEYFGYTTAIDVFKDSATRKAAGLRGKNEWHPNFFVSDTDRLVESIVEADRNVLAELLTTPRTFVVTGNTKQADGVKKNATKPFSLFAQTTLNIYEIGITRKEWSDERAFAMPKEHRRGILTHPSWLIAHSTNFDNHAIDRGRWIRERLLGGRIPEIPVTVDAQLPEEPEHTLRERMRVTRDEYCWQCHRQMDPLGLPFEQFDHFGQYRTAELDQPVVTSGHVEGSGDEKLDGPVNDPFELIEKLAASKRVEQVFVRHVFRYFIGRNETLADGPTLVTAHKAYVDNGGSFKELIVSLLSSNAFLYRTSSDNHSTAQNAFQNDGE
ncbi:MAG: DUF1588 domain-containing protein [Planctomycetes bacterium]|nr:DUF1588 domain-containing protein [Planctomycetota bacterium]